MMSTIQTVGSAVGAGSHLGHVLQIKVRVRAILVEKEMDISSILSLVPGSILEFEKGFDQEIELHVSVQIVAKGYAVKVGENFGLRISSIPSVEDRINALGPMR